ncbi:MAG: hypothetical protein ACK4K7_01975 [Allosphingosinicella sp.]|uniref:hypothetical protein n=1 Tax=Allosphingosinicella sp. TaxID=2823234 RepID=UPI0039343440
MLRALFPALLLLAAAPATAAPESLGVFSLWGAFRDGGRCYAIAEPAQVSRDADQRPFAAVGYWPARGRAGQVHFRLSREKRPGSAVLLRIDGRSFQLLAGPRDAWAPDPRADAEIQAAMRMGLDMTVETRSTRGALVRDQYGLRGAATAIDAAAVACAR